VAAGVAYASPSDEPDTTGLPPAVAKQVLADHKRKHPAPEIYVENWPYVELFLALQTQWNVHGYTGQRTGLNYPAAESVLRMRNIPELKRATYFQNLQIIEHAALKTWNTQKPDK